MLQTVIEGRFEAVENPFPSQIFASDLLPEGWSVVEDVSPTEFEVKDLEFITFLEEGESSVNGETMRQRAINLKANLGLVDAKRMLAHQDEIPVKMRGKYIIFTGTLLRGPDGLLYVACLYWRDDRWDLHFLWLGHDWHDGARLARRKPARNATA